MKTSAKIVCTINLTNYEATLVLNSIQEYRKWLMRRARPPSVGAEKRANLHKIHNDVDEIAKAIVQQIVRMT